MSVYSCKMLRIRWPMHTYDFCFTAFEKMDKYHILMMILNLGIIMTYITLASDSITSAVYFWLSASF